jgi:hypothetical protein
MVPIIYLAVPCGIDLRRVLSILTCLKGHSVTLHSILPSASLVPAGTSKSTLRRHSIQAVTSVMAYVADAATLLRCLQQCVLDWRL